MQNAYCIHDTKTGAYRVPFFCHHDADAIRQVISAVADERTELSRFPADFVLFRIGDYDENTGVLTPSVPVHIGGASSLYAAHLMAASKARETEQV